MNQTTAQLRARERAILEELERRKSASDRQAEAILDREDDAPEYDPRVDTSEQQASYLLNGGEAR